MIIIDCFEVFIGRPSSLKARAQTWSNYMKHNTAKFLIGACPIRSDFLYFKSLGVGVGEHVSDVYLTEYCGLLNICYLGIRYRQIEVLLLRKVQVCIVLQ